MSSLLGLAGYQGDSEISDSEGEASPTVDRGPQPPGVGENDTPPLQAVLTCLSTVSSGLGIPRSVVQQEVPATEPFVRPVVQSAPSIGLVAYYHDDEEGLGEDEENMVSGHHIAVCVGDPALVTGHRSVTDTPAAAQGGNTRLLLSNCRYYWQQ